jgi:hypothetical protein
VLQHAITTALNRAGVAAGCRPIRWSHPAGGLVGHVSSAEYDDAEAVRVAQGWAELLGLAEVADAVSGTREWRGQLDDGRLVVLWCVADRELFERDVMAGRPAEGDRGDSVESPPRPVPRC